MDITKELKEIQNNPKVINELIEEINQQLIELRKMGHLYKVVYVANEIENLINTEEFKKAEVKKIRIFNDMQYEGDYKVQFFLDDKDLSIQNIDNILENLSQNIGRFDSELCDKDFYYYSLNPYQVEINTNAKKIIINTLLSEELKSIEISEDGLDRKIIGIESQKNELKKKSHILKILSISNQMEDFVKKDFFKKANINEIRLYITQDYDNGPLYQFELINEKEPLSYHNNDEEYIKVFDTLENLFSQITEFDHDFTNHELQNESIELKTGISDRLVNLLLSDELLKALNYNLIKIELSGNINVNKKFKI
jgi:hypothetical protein